MKINRERPHKPEIHQVEGENFVLVDGISIPGFVADEPCPVCGTLKVYHESYDAYFCPVCRKWLEGRCLSPWCEYCRKRPKDPLQPA